MMEQDVEVALRITEAIIEKTAGNPSGAAFLPKAYVRLFSEVHVRVKVYFSSETAGNGYPSHSNRSGRENGRWSRCSRSQPQVVQSPR